MPNVTITVQSIPPGAYGLLQENINRRILALEVANQRICGKKNWREMSRLLCMCMFKMHVISDKIRVISYHGSKLFWADVKWYRVYNSLSKKASLILLELM